MIKYDEDNDGDASICVVYKQFHFTALVLAHPLEIAIWHFVRHGRTVYVVAFYLHFVRGGLRRVVQRAQQFVVGSGLADTGVADAA